MAVGFHGARVLDHILRGNSFSDRMTF